MQEDVLQPLLTVTEAMVAAAKLKLGTEIGHDEKLEVVCNSYSSENIYFTVFLFT